MFAFFVNDIFSGFWCNEIGDEFVLGTCKSLKLNPEKVDVVFYHNVALPPEYFETDGNKNLYIKSRVVSYETEIVIDPETNEEKEIQKEVISFVTSEVIEPDFFFEKGQIIQAC